MRIKLTELIGEFELLTAAALIGIGLVFQKSAMVGGTIGPFTYTASRFVISSISILLARPWIHYFRRKATKKKRRFSILDEVDAVDQKKRNQRIFNNIMLWGFLTSIGLTGGNVFQQLALVTTEASKVAFICGLYVIFTPIFVFFIPGLSKGLTKWTWIAAVISIIGLYCLTGASSHKTATENKPDDQLIGFLTLGIVYAVLSMLFFVAIVITVTIGVKQLLLDPIDFSSVYLTLSTLWFIALSMVFEFEQYLAPQHYIFPHWINILSIGIFIMITSVLRTFGQMTVSPTKCSVILSLSTVFCAIASFIYLNELLNGVEILGCCFMFAALLISSLLGGSDKTIQVAPPPEGIDGEYEWIAAGECSLLNSVCSD